MLNAVKHPSASQDDVWRGGVPTPDAVLSSPKDSSLALGMAFPTYFGDTHQVHEVNQTRCPRRYSLGIIVLRERRGEMP